MENNEKEEVEGAVIENNSESTTESITQIEEDQERHRKTPQPIEESKTPFSL